MLELKTLPTLENEEKEMPKDRRKKKNEKPAKREAKK